MGKVEYKRVMKTEYMPDGQEMIIMEKVILELTSEQLDSLHFFLLITEKYRKDEQEACESLSKRKKADGTLEFPKMKSNAEFWEKKNENIDEIIKIVEKKKFGN